MASTTVAGEPVAVNGRQYRAVREGLAQILAPYRESAGKLSAAVDQKSGAKSHNNDEGDQAVFYNPIQQYNRDLSVLAILTYGEGCLAEKQARIQKKEKKKGKAKKQRKNASRASKTDEGVDDQAVNVAAGEAGQSKKRKADEIGGGDEASKVNEKRLRAGEDEDDGLEVRQLDVDIEVQITTEPKERADHASQSAVTAAKTLTDGSDKKPISFTILDALSASGLRAVRYAKEIPFATNVVANDLSSEAVKSIELNIDHNGLRGKVHSNVGDARAYMYSKVGNEQINPSTGYVHRFDVVDLDPYGTAAPFLDSAVQAVTDGGLLCVTCTDAGVFASNGYPEKAFSLYGGVTMKGPFSHEAGLRLILHAIATSAARYGIAIEPLLSLSIDFYVRLFVRVHKQQQQAKLLAGTTMITYSCDNGCGAWSTQLVARNQERVDKIGQTIFKHSYAQGPTTASLCECCGSKMHLGGPMWAGPLHNPYFVQRILDKLPDVDRSTYQTVDRIKGMLTLALEEDLTLAKSNESSTSNSEPVSVPAPTPADTRLIPRMPPHVVDATPFFVIPSLLAKTLHCSVPSEDQLRGAIRHLGYKDTRSHCKAGSLKTNAPWEVLWEIMREWIRQHAPVKPGKVTKGMPGWRIMQKIRGTELKSVADVHENIKRALERGVDGKDGLKSLLESGLYRLEHPKLEEVEATNRDKDPGTNAEGASVPEQKPAWNEVQEVSKLKIVFDAELGKEKPRGRLVRYQINPRANWGPMSRAGN